MNHGKRRVPGRITTAGQIDPEAWYMIHTCVQTSRGIETVPERSYLGTAILGRFRHLIGSRASVHGDQIVLPKP